MNDAQAHTCGARNKQGQKPISFPSILFLGELDRANGIQFCLVN